MRQMESNYISTIGVSTIPEFAPLVTLDNSVILDTWQLIEYIDDDSIVSAFRAPAKSEYLTDVL